MTNQTPESVIAEVIEYHADAIDTHGPGCYKNHAACLAVKLRDMLLEPGVPDAATEIARSLARASTITGADAEAIAGASMKLAALGEIAELHALCDDRLWSVEKHAERMEAERDAATAAVERVRAIHVRDEYGLCAECSWEYPETSYDALSNDVSWPCPTVAALDGAPEPEALELPETGLEVRDGDGDLITTGEHRRVLHQGGYVCDTCVNILGINVRWDRADRMEGHPLPAEGERK